MTLVYQVGVRRASPQRTFRSSSLSSILKACPEFLLLTGQQHADVRTKCTLIKKSWQKKFLQQQVKTAIKKSSSWGDFLKRLEQMYQVYETDLIVRTEIEELPPPPEFPKAARNSEFVAQLEKLMGRMNPSSYGPT